MTKQEKNNYRNSFYWKNKMLKVYGRLAIKNIIKAFKLEKLFDAK